MKKSRRKLVLPIAICSITAAIIVIVWAAYFARGEFKDVFVNKKDYFSANVLYDIKSMTDDMKEVGSGGRRCEISVYNHDLSTGDFNGFDVTFDVFAWLEGAKPLPVGKSYVLSCGGNSVNITGTEHTNAVFQGLTLAGGNLSTVTLTAEFCYEDDEDLTDAPGLYVVAVPTAPKRLTSFMLGAIICPSHSDAFAVSAAFDSTGEVITDYAAFTYRINTSGNSPEGDKIAVRWKSNALIPIRINGKEFNAESVTSGDFGNGFDQELILDAITDHSDYIVFFRNSGSDIWASESQTWGLLYEQVSFEYIKS